jgi:hypothetical protein
MTVKATRLLTIQQLAKDKSIWRLRTTTQQTSRRVSVFTLNSVLYVRNHSNWTAGLLTSISCVPTIDRIGSLVVLNPEQVAAPSNPSPTCVSEQHARRFCPMYRRHPCSHWAEAELDYRTRGEWAARPVGTRRPESLGVTATRKVPRAGVPNPAGGPCEAKKNSLHFRCKLFYLYFFIYILKLYQLSYNKIGKF